MTDYIFRSNGNYLGFISNGNLFSRDGEYLGWIENDIVWDSRGNFRGKVTEINNKKYILRNTFVIPPIPKAPKAPPVPPVPPVPPANLTPINPPIGSKDSF
jgi:hypothetical protein|tara:strand:+ start:1514 stop:1816 length:303 start_codon:yes stop_codon:yes gene_type:complete